MKKNLKKELGLLDVFCVATGAMISSGLFILPGLAFAKAGPAVVLSYVLAGLICIPTLLSKSELITAMPKAGGDYFYIMRGFGPLLGTLAGFSAWLSLSLKGAFALMGMGAYLSIITNIPLTVIAVLCCLFFICLNLIGIKAAGRFQVILVSGLVAILTGYVIWGIGALDSSNYSPFFSGGANTVLATTSFVFISYGGLTKVVALAEEIRNPGRTIPLGMILSLIVTVFFYAVVILVTIGVLDPEVLKRTLTPISDGAAALGGNSARIAVSVGAFLAFVSTANSGIMAASRYPLGMGRDRLLPSDFQRVSHRFKTPYVSIIFTGLFMILAILFLRLELLVKVASSILILLFIFANLTLILFRESNISSYKPQYRSPLYPYLQVLGILCGGFLLVEMGTFVVFLTTMFLLLGFVWYKVYAQKQASRDSALMHILERLVATNKELTSDSLLTELRDIVVERDQMIRDSFHRLVMEADVLDIDEPLEMEDFFKELSQRLGKYLNMDAGELCNKFVDRETQGTTMIAKGLAIPHIVVEGRHGVRMLLIRAKAGIIFPHDEVAHTIFALVGSADQRLLHLRVLAAIVQTTQYPEFKDKWFGATSTEDLRNIVLLAERKTG